MDKLIVTGGIPPLRGDVLISGAKNAALPILFAALLTDRRCRVDNVPDLRDIRSALTVLARLGVSYDRRRRRVELQASAQTPGSAPYELVRTMRASILVLGPLLARFGHAEVSLPGGCAIGTRPVDMHIAGLRQMGAVISVENGYIRGTCRRLHGADIRLSMPSVTGTENLLMAATLAEGQTVIRNAAREPEVVDLAAFLTAMGADITGAGEEIMIVNGVSALGGASYRVMPDRIEAGTYLAAVAVVGGDIFLQDARAADMEAVISVFGTGGVRIRKEGGGLRVRAARRFKAVGTTTAPYPGFPTDMQAQLIAVNSVARGAAAVTETVFENRFMHIPELNRMGAKITLHNNTAEVEGIRRLAGAPVMATDLRASASLLIAALAAEGKTEISRIYHLDRGYERIERKLRVLGAKVRRVRA